MHFLSVMITVIYNTVYALRQGATPKLLYQ